MSELILYDSVFLSGDVLGDRDNIFKMEDKPTRILPYKNDIHNAVTYEMSHTKNIYQRQVYGVLDWLRDIGGLYGSLSAICIGIVFVFQFQGTNMFLMTEMFAVARKD